MRHCAHQAAILLNHVVAVAQLQLRALRQARLGDLHQRHPGLLELTQTRVVDLRPRRKWRGRGSASPHSWSRSCPIRSWHWLQLPLLRRRRKKARRAQNCVHGLRDIRVDGHAIVFHVSRLISAAFFYCLALLVSYCR